MKIKLTIPLISLLFFLSCDSLLLKQDESVVSLEEDLQVPAQLDDGLAIASPESEQVNMTGIKQLITRIYNDLPKNMINSLLIARNNKLVVEAYFNGWNRNRRQDLRSATKSITSTLIGIAIDQKIFPGVQAKILDYFPEYDSYQNWDDRKAQITIEDFLRMRTGLECDDWVSSSPGNEEKMYKTNDWVKFILDLPMINDPGTVFSYCTGAPVTLGALLANASGQRIPDFAEKNLFGPLHIKDYTWNYTPNGGTDTGGHMHMLPRDLLKFGLLFLNNGNWKGQQIVSREWVNKSTKITGLAGSEGYGYLWWGSTWNINGSTISAYYADGNGGQLIFVIPAFNAVVVFTGGQYNEDFIKTRLGVMGKTILPAFQ